MGDSHPDTANTHAELPGYWTFNARLDYRDSDSGLSVSLFVENISDDVNIARMFYPEIIAGTDGVNVTKPLVYGVTVSYDF